MLVDSSRILPPQPGKNVTLFYRSKKYEVTPGDKTPAITPKEMGNRQAPPATTSHHSSTLGPVTGGLQQVRLPPLHLDSE